jgi:transcription initiation factor TFIID TATA-box-binding protein
MTDVDVEIRPSDLVCHNVLALAEVNRSLNLEKVVRYMKHAEYDDTKFSCVRVRLWKYRCSVAIFSSGKLQVTGAETPEDAHNALRFIAFRLKNLCASDPKGDPVIFSNFRIDNVLATFDIGSKMDLYGLSRDPDLTVTYMPSQFAAAVVREVSSGVVVDVFSSGKMNIKGKGTLDRICKGVNMLMPKIARHLCEDLE